MGRATCWIVGSAIGALAASRRSCRRRVRPQPTTPAAVLELAVKLKRETPGRTAAQVTAIIAAAEGSAPSERTIQRLFARLGLNTRPDGTPPAAFGRFEAAAANDRWTGDALHGPVVGGHKAYLFAFIDDHSRAIPGYRWGHSEDTVRLEAALRHGLGSRGIPRSIYVDNGSAFVAAPLLRACAVLGHPLDALPPWPPRRPRQDRTVLPHRARSVPVEIAAREVADLVEMNRLFAALGRDRLSPPGPLRDQARRRWTGSSPAARSRSRHQRSCTRRSCGPSMRIVTKTATVSLHGNTFEVDAALVGRQVECVFDPFDLTAIEVRYQDRAMGHGRPAADRPPHPPQGHDPNRRQHRPPPASTTSPCSPTVTPSSSPTHAPDRLRRPPCRSRPPIPSQCPGQLHDPPPNPRQAKRPT